MNEQLELNLPRNDLTCRLCKEEEVEVEDGEKTSSYCNSCFFHVLILRHGEMYILEEDVKELEWTYQTVPAEILNPFDSCWDDLPEDDDYYDSMIEEREHSPHLAKWRDIPQEQWIKEKN
tara:strand:+ start:65 stop:424 length:360 start_codon:yes stop_codon:yes gene_type:complete